VVHTVVCSPGPPPVVLFLYPALSYSWTLLEYKLGTLTLYRQHIHSKCGRWTNNITQHHLVLLARFERSSLYKLHSFSQEKMPFHR
jgi:hypothetical protein